MTETEFKVRRAITFIEKLTVGQIADMTDLDHQVVNAVVQNLLEEGYVTRVEPSLLEIRKEWGWVRRTYALIDDPEMRSKLYASIETFQLERDKQGISIGR